LSKYRSFVLKSFFALPAQQDDQLAILQFHHAITCITNAANSIVFIYLSRDALLLKFKARWNNGITNYT
jgi:hypothetical protein